MKDKAVVCLLITLLFISWSTQDESEDALSVSSFDERERDRVAHAVNEFGYNLTLKMMKGGNNTNIVISPTGIAGLLAMTLLGSVGSTYDELAKALGFSQDILENRKNHEQFGYLLQKLNEKSNYSVEDSSTKETNPNDTLDDTVGGNTTVSAKIEDIQTRTLYADAIVVDAKTRVRNVYRDYLDKVYRGDAITAHFEDTDTTRRVINDWVNNNTAGQIVEFLMEPLPVNTKVVLLSALYFSGQWARPFIPEYTRKMTFHRPSGDVIADMMLNLGDFNYIFKSSLDAHMIAFPYNDTATTMYIIKPFRKNSTLPELMEKLNYSIIEQLIQNLTSQQCVVRFPKMDLSAKADLKSSLNALGIKSLFLPADANFALMVDTVTDSNQRSDDIELLERIYESDNETKKLLRDTVNGLPNPGVYVDKVLHDVKMSINEYGTVAAAASSGVLSRTAKLFYADSPFYMFIRNEKTKLITFSAAIFDPTDT